MKNTWRTYQNYIIIAIISLIAVFFLPMLGSGIGIALSVPTTVVGWIVFILTKLCIVVINILTLDQFIKQAKVNIKDNEKFLEADAYFNIHQIDGEEEILTPRAYIGGIYRHRMTKIGIGSILGVFGFTQAMLTFDWVSMLTYLFTVVSGLLYGWMTMNDVEDYWTDKYYKLMEKDRNEKAKKDMAMATEKSSESPNDNIHTDRGSNILEPADCNGSTSNTDQPMVVEYIYSNIYCMGIDSPSDTDTITNNNDS